MKGLLSLLAAAACVVAAEDATCVVPVVVQECGAELHLCKGSVRALGEGELLPCSATIKDATAQVAAALRAAATDPVAVPSQVTLGACSVAADGEGNFAISALGKRASCSPLLKINNGLIQTAAGIATAPADDGMVAMVWSAVSMVLEGLVETSALTVAHLASVKAALRKLVRAPRPLVFQYTLTPNWVRVLHQPSKLTLSLMNDTTMLPKYDSTHKAYSSNYLHSVRDAEGEQTALGLAVTDMWSAAPRGISHAMPYAGERLTMRTVPKSQVDRPFSVFGGVTELTPHAQVHMGAFIEDRLSEAAALTITLRFLVPPLGAAAEVKGQFAVGEGVLCKAGESGFCRLDRNMVRAGVDFQRSAETGATAGSRDNMVGLSFRQDTCTAMLPVPMIVPWAQSAPGVVSTVAVSHHRDATVDVQLNGMSLGTLVPSTTTWKDSPVMAKSAAGHRLCWMSVYQRHVFIPPKDGTCSLEAMQTAQDNWSTYTHHGWYSYMNLAPGKELQMSLPELALRQFPPLDRLQAHRTTIASVPTWYGRIQTPVPADLVLRASEGLGFGAGILGRVAAVSVHYMDHPSGVFRELATGWNDINGQDIHKNTGLFPRAAGGVILAGNDGYILASRSALLAARGNIWGSEPPACRQFLIKCSSVRSTVPAEEPTPCFVARLVKVSTPDLDMALLKVERGLGMGTARSPGTINPAAITPGTYGSRGVKLFTESMRKCVKRVLRGQDAPARTLGWNGHDGGSRFAESDAAVLGGLDPADDVVRPLADATPALLAGSPTFFDPAGAGRKVHRCIGALDTDTHRESPVLIGMTAPPLEEVAAGTGQELRDITHTGLIETFLAACVNGNRVPPVLDPGTLLMDLPRCVQVLVDPETGVLRQGRADGLPSYID